MLCNQLFNFLDWFFTLLSVTIALIFCSNDLVKSPNEASIKSFLNSRGRDELSVELFSSLLSLVEIGSVSLYFINRFLMGSLGSSVDSLFTSSSVGTSLDREGED